MPRAQPDAPSGVDDVDGRHQVAEVGQRLTHAHEYQVVHALARRRFDPQDLLDDLADLEVARPAVKPARAELAAVGAADLAGNAERPPVARLAVERGRGRD